jgi:hypothetical protein
MDVRVTAARTFANVTVPEDGWITGFSQEVYGVPESSLRFSWLYDESERDPLCPGNPRTLFVMSVEKTPEFRYPDGFGYPVQKGDVLRVFGGFANFTDEDYPSASFGMSIGFVPASSGAALEEAYPIFLNSECSSLFVVPPYAASFVKDLAKPFTVPFDGRLVLIATHSHKYSKEMTLFLNDDAVWETTPVHLPDGTNLGNPIYKAPYNGVPVKAGDLLNFRTEYANPTGKPTDAMSSVYIQLIPGPGDYPGAHH